MIVFDLQCEQRGHVFEGWFSSSDDYGKQLDQGLLCCPLCGDTKISKAVMAPNIGRKGNQQPPSIQADENTPIQELDAKSLPMPGVSRPSEKADTAILATEGSSGSMPSADAKRLLAALAEAQSKVLAQSKWVGRNFAEQARAMHYGEADKKPIHGEATGEEAVELIDEGIALMPLALPVRAPEKEN